MCFTEVFGKTVELMLLHGHKNLYQLPGCFEFEIDQNWKVILNPHSQSAFDITGGEVLPYNMIVKHRSVPVGVFDPYGGTIMSEAEHDLNTVLTRQLEKLKHESK